MEKGPHRQPESQQWLEGKDLRAAEGTARTSTQGRCFRKGAPSLSFCAACLARLDVLKKRPAHVERACVMRVVLAAHQ